MAVEGIYISRYERRIQLVVDALLEKSESSTEAPMAQETARQVATRVLHVLDHIPEKLR